MYVAPPSMTRNKLLARIGLTFQRLLVEAWSGLQHFTDAYTKPRKAIHNMLIDAKVKVASNCWGQQAKIGMPGSEHDWYHGWRG
jgi:hypothetical protein